MTHEPECPNQPEYHDGSILWPALCYCGILRAAYQRGVDYGMAEWDKATQEAFRNGYNAHAESRAHGEQMYGPYPRPVKGLADIADERMLTHWNQHGSGENP